MKQINCFAYFHSYRECVAHHIWYMVYIVWKHRVKLTYRILVPLYGLLGIKRRWATDRQAEVSLTFHFLIPYDFSNRIIIYNSAELYSHRIHIPLPFSQLFWLHFSCPWKQRICSPGGLVGGWNMATPSLRTLIFTTFGFSICLRSHVNGDGDAI